MTTKSKKFRGSITHNAIKKSLGMDYQVIESVTNNGKKCFAVLTDLRLSKDDFKSLMSDIQIAEGYGFVKFFADHKKRLVSAVNIERPLFESLVSQYEWVKPEPKETATKKTGKATNKTKQKETATGGETPSIDPALLAQFLEFQKMIKK